jgi:DNA-binding MarR family transcriptional regulator
MLVAGHADGANVGQLAEALVMDLTTVTAALKALERRAMLRVDTAAEDLRQRRVRLTAQGQALLAEATVAWQALQAQVRRERPPSELRPSLRQLAMPAQESKP